jgi:hypothetical protein
VSGLLFCGALTSGRGMSGSRQRLVDQGGAQGGDAGRTGALIPGRFHWGERLPLRVGDLNATQAVQPERVGKAGTLWRVGWREVCDHCGRQCLSIRSIRRTS